MVTMSDDLSPTRLCSRCAARKPESAFTRDKSKSSGFKSYCKACDAERSNRYYHERKSPALKLVQNQRQAESFRAAKGRALVIYGGACVSCGSTERLEFDHVANDGAEHRADEPRNAMIRRIAREGRRLEDVALRLLCQPCHRGPGISTHAPRPTPTATAVARMVAALELRDEHAPLVALAELYAAQLDAAPEDSGVSRDLGPKLLAVLVQLRATPATEGLKREAPLGRLASFG